MELNAILLTITVSSLIIASLAMIIVIAAMKKFFARRNDHQRSCENRH